MAGDELVEREGVAALGRLLTVAGGFSGQSRYMAMFLLGLYNGQRFPFDLTRLRAVDEALFDDCMAVLRMDARLTRREVQQYFEDGGRRWERLAEDWRALDVEALVEAARTLAADCAAEGRNAEAAAAVMRLLADQR